MASIKSLFKDTAIYGVSSIVGRFLNWCLVPMYTYLFAANEYGIVTNIYAYVALALVILTYGMETGFFRFANHERWTDPQEVYSTGLISLATSSLLFIIAGCLISPELAALLDCGAHPSFVWMMVITVGVDAFTALPFAYLRYQKRPLRFATLKLLNIGLNIGLNIFFVLLCPWIWKTAPQTISWFYNPTFGIGYIFLANLISSLVVLLLLYPELTKVRYRFNGQLLKEMLLYSYPILILGIAGIMNQTLDKILYPMLISDKVEAMTGLGIYGANYKIAIVMVMFTQAFRFAYEPFIFAQNKEVKGDDKNASYVQAMNWFVVFGLFIFLGVMFYLPVLRYFISPQYFVGLKVVPIIMMAEFFAGIFFNLSLWYKLSDQTIWGTWFSLMGLVVTVALNVAFVPTFGYIACAWAAFGCYGIMMLASYLVGQKKYPINYELGKLALYFIVALALLGIANLLTTDNLWIDFSLRLLLLVAYCGAVLMINRAYSRKTIKG
jgi:O-antigen/teichoic acid export membrane protein